MKFLDKFGKELLFFDGAMGTQLQQNGLKAGGLPEAMNLSAPDVLVKIHRSYLEAGCDVVTTNTFGANSLKLSDTKGVIAAAVGLAKKAVAESSKNAFVALDTGPLGRLLKPCGDLDFDEAYSLFAEQMIAGEKAGADLILIETMGDLYEIKAAVLAAKENTRLPVLVSMIFDEKGVLLTGADVKTAVLTVEAFGADGIGLNCGLGPEQMLSLVDEAVKYASVPVFVQPNAGLPICVNGKTSYNVTPSEFAEKQRCVLEKGSRRSRGLLRNNARAYKGDGKAVPRRKNKARCRERLFGCHLVFQNRFSRRKARDYRRKNKSYGQKNDESRPFK